MIELAKLCSALCSAVVLGGGVAVLALSLAAKLGGWAETGMLWPVTGASRRFAGPAQVTGVEGMVVAAALAPVTPVPARLGSVGLLFAVYALVALRLRGRRRACFGGRPPTRVTGGHAAACAGVAVLAGVGLIAGLVGGWPGGSGTGRAWFASVEVAIGLVLAALAALTALAVGRLRTGAAADRGHRAATDAAAGRPVSAAAHGLAEIRDLLRRSASATAPSPAASPKAGPGKARVPA